MELSAPLRKGFRRHFLLTERRLARGEQRLGWKIAFSTPAAQQATGLSNALAAALTSGSLRPADRPYDVRDGTQVIAEAEIGVVLAHDVAAGAPRASIAAAISHYQPALEITDSDRPLDQLEDIVAEGIFHRALYLGEQQPGPPGADFTGIEAIVRIDGTVRHRVDVQAATGDPIRVLSHLARLLDDLGQSLRAGDLVILGCMAPVIDPPPGARVELELSTGIRCECRFVLAAPHARG